MNSELRVVNKVYRIPETGNRELGEEVKIQKEKERIMSYLSRRSPNVVRRRRMNYE